MNRYLQIALCTLLTAGCTALHSPTDAGTDAGSSTLGLVWEPVGSAPLALNDACPGWRCSGSGDPALATTADGGVSLYFTTVGISEESDGGFASSINIGRASGANATTLGIDPDAPVVAQADPGNWDPYRETVSVNRDDSGVWRMWYLGYLSPDFAGNALGQMQATDGDGKSWPTTGTKIYQALADGWDGALVTGPSALRGPDGLWRLYYSGVGTGNGVGLLTSSDGTTWTPEPSNPVLAASPGNWDDTILEQTIRYAGGTYWMWYSAYRGPLEAQTSIAIGLATSTDGVRWTRYVHNPVLSPGDAGTWDDLATLAPDVLVEPDGSFLMAAYGHSQAEGNNQPGHTGLWRSH